MKGIKLRIGVTVGMFAFLATYGVMCATSARAAEPLSPFTGTVFFPDGEINEFIQVSGDSQLYFIADPSLENPLDANFGAIRVDALLTRGVFVTRDNSPEPGSNNEAGQTGHRDLPGSRELVFVPTGFNIGRVFASYNRDAYNREGAYFLAMDVSAPAVLDPFKGTQPVAFDVDGDGSTETVTELNPEAVGEAPSRVSFPDGYAFELDTDGDSVPDVGVLIAERPGSPPASARPIDPGGNVQLIPNAQGDLVMIRRYVVFEDLTGTLIKGGTLPPTVVDGRTLTDFFLDANDDGIVNHLDVGVGSDVEIVIRHAHLLPNNHDPACISITYLADSFDDEPLGGGGEDLVMFDVRFPVPDIEVTKKVRCIDEPDTEFRTTTSVVPGSTVEYGVTIQNLGNRDLDLTIENDILSCIDPAMATLVPSSCVVTEAPLGFDDLAFCAAFELALVSPFGTPDGFPMTNVVTLGAIVGPDMFEDCPTGLGEQLIFTYQAAIGPEGENAELCDQEFDCVNGISVSGRLTEQVDPILAPSPPSPDSPTGNEEEVDCPDEPCCNGRAGCIPNDGFGDVDDEFFFTVHDAANVVDTHREMDAGDVDDNVALVEIECRSVTLTKEVRLLPDEEFTTELDRTDIPSAPAQIEYRYTIVNGGEVDEQTTLDDADLCDDIAAIQAQLSPGQIGFVDCPLCTDAPGGTIDVTIPGNDSFVASCTIHIADEIALRAFTRADEQRAECQAVTKAGTTDVLCYRNCAQATADATNLGNTCPGSTIISDSFATVCHPICDIAVTKQVRCLDNCTDRNPTGTFMDLLETSPGSCVQYSITITNTSDDIPMCRLRIQDALGDQGNCILFVEGESMSVDDHLCPQFPPAFQADGTPFRWDPIDDCGIEALQPGSSLNIVFNARIPDHAQGRCRPINEATVLGTSDCRGNDQPSFTCQASDQATVQVLIPELTCLSKEWAAQWDRDGDCAPDGDFTAFSSNLDLQGLVFPITLRLKVRAQNTGDVPLNIRPEDDALLGCLAAIEAASLADPANCEIGEDKLVMPGIIDMWTCDILVETAEAMRALDACDGFVDDRYSNVAEVFGTPVSGGTDICVPDDDVVAGDETCAATVLTPPPCAFDTEKEVKCADESDLSYEASVDSIPASALRYRLKVTNTSSTTPMPRVCIADQLSCAAWFRPGSIAADIDGSDVTACITALFEPALTSGNLECYTFAACRPGAPWIGPTETLSISFEVQSPADFSTVGVDPDCTNAITVNGRTEVCVPDDVEEVNCAVGEADADFDVLVPDLTCEKTVRADLGNDGSFDLDFAADLPLPCDGPFPLRLQYRFEVTNTGETPLINVQACDQQLRADAKAAGLGFGPCVVPGNPDGCGSIPSLDPGGSTTAICEIIVPSRELWEAFAGLDGDSDIECYDNQANAQAEVDTSSICDAEANTSVTSPSCSARVCLAPECHISVTKQVRCLDGCDSGIATTDAKDLLEVAGGACLEYEVNVTNTDAALPVCRLRIADALSNQPLAIGIESDSARFRVGETICPTPAGFNVDGIPFEWDPQECGLTALEPGDTLTFTFNATVPIDADTEISPLNHVSIDGAPACPNQGPTFCCHDEASATVDILEPSLTCVAKEWAVRWDDNGDCAPNSAFGEFSDTLDLRDIVFPAILRLRIRAENTGPVPMDISAADAGLTACVDSTPGVAFVDLEACELDLEKLVMPGAAEAWTCDVSVESAEAMRELDGCDGGSDDFYRNTASVSGILTQAGLNVCVPQARVIEGDATCSASLRVPEPCEFQTSKQVKCADEPDSAYAATTDALPGSTMRYRIQIENNSDHTKMPRVCIRENLMCFDWADPVSIQAELAGQDVTACVAAAVAGAIRTGDPECITFADCRPAAPWIAPGEILNITFDATVDPGYRKTEFDPDCTNEVVVDGFPQVCPPETVHDAWCRGPGANASFDVLIPALECSKEIRADFGNNGSFDTPLTSSLDLPCDAAFPVRLEYRIGATNTGQTPLTDVAICDEQLLNDAQAAGLTIGDCDLLLANGACANLPSLGQGSSATRFCQVIIPDRPAWDRLTALGGTGLSNCHANSAVALGLVDVGPICGPESPMLVRSEECKAAVCLAPQCEMAVTNSVRCVTDCKGEEPEQPLFDRLDTTTGSCVEFVAEIQNNSADESLCRLRISNTLSGGPSEIVAGASVQFQVGPIQCPVPSGFNLGGTPFEWDPVLCGLHSLDPGQSLTMIFDAKIPAGADPDVSRLSTVVVEGSPTCVIDPNQCCNASADATVDVLQPSVIGERTEWSVQSDHDGDCEPDGTFGDPTPNLFVDGEVFPVHLQLSVDARNDGSVPLDVIVTNDAFIGCVSATPDVSVVPGTCEFGNSKHIPAAALATWNCQIRVDTVKAMRALDLCDGAADEIIETTPQISATLTAGDTDVCVAPVGGLGAILAPPAQVHVPPRCALEVTKTVACLEGCATETTTTEGGEALQVVAGSHARFSLEITNTSPSINVPRLCVSDLLTQPDWLCAGGVSATLAGNDVTADVGSLVPDGSRHCFTFAGRPAAPWIAPGETLAIHMDVEVPEPFDIRGDETDCENTASVEAFTQACATEGKKACIVEATSASIDVRIPEIRCQRSIAVDLRNDGTIDLHHSSDINMSNPTFPLRLIHRMNVKNTGELLLKSPQACDQRLVIDALAAGISVGPCDLCGGDPCDSPDATCGDLPDLAIGESHESFCELVLEDRGQWMAFAGADRFSEGSDCRVDRSQGEASLTPPCSPPGFDPLMISEPCETAVCFSFIEACPTTKASFEIWNENEVRFTGTERCVYSWDEQPLSVYTQDGVPNYFLRSALQTPRGRARIDGIADPKSCGSASIPAPLIGVAAKFLTYGEGGLAASGITLVGDGAEAGSIVHPPQAGDGPFVGTDGTLSNSVALSIDEVHASALGSLLVFPKVELKWNAAGDLIQDTLISITNDFDRAVRVQLYLVQGDRAQGEVLAGQPPEVIERAHGGCNWIRDEITLTANEPTYWSALTGAPKGVSPFTALDPGSPPGRPDDDERNLGGRVLRGYVLAWAVNDDGFEIRWNHLDGNAVVVGYQNTFAWEYRAWPFPAMAGGTTGNVLRSPAGRLDLDGREYAAAPAVLLFQFMAPGKELGILAGTDNRSVGTDLTLWASFKDFRGP